MIETADGALRVGPAVVAVGVFGGRAVDEHAVADVVAVDVRADRFDLTGGVGSWNERQRRLPRVRAGSNVDVDGIHAHRAQTHHNLFGCRFGIGEIFKLENLRTAMLADENRLHGAMLS